MAKVIDRWHKSRPGKDEPECSEHKGKVRASGHGKGKRWQVRYRDPQGEQRAQNFERRVEAEALAATIDADLRRGTYIDPNAGKIALEDYAQQWVAGTTAGPTTVERYEGVIRNHITPHLGRHSLRSLNQPSVIQGWLRKLQDADLGASTIGSLHDVLSGILDAAVDDGLMPRNPCRAASVKLPKRDKKKIVPWSLERVHAVIGGLPERFRCGGSLAFGCGLRQGEVFGIAVEDIDYKRGVIHVNRQIRIVRNKMVFSLPKGNKIRMVPLPAELAKALKAHTKQYPPTKITLPWRVPDGEPRTYRLLFTDAKGKPYNRSVFNQGDWKRALVAAGVIPPRTTGAQYFAAAPDDGMHALRHAYASVLLDAGETIKALAEYLGHSDPGFTLRTYTHLMPTSEARTRRAIDKALLDARSGAPAVGEGGEGPEGPPEEKNPGVCTRCALAA
ncbi:MAG: site-specific integrase [Streptomycetaceae bacterium]|nr:site-specific integrase [Streptomycetaceae bacterium]